MGIQFDAPVVAGTVLIRTAIQSQDFGVDDQGNSTGWQIGSDGSATFDNITIGNDAYTIDDSGVGSFEDVNVADDLFLNGVSLSDTLAGLPGGLIGYGDSTGANVTGASWTVDSAAISTTAIGVIEFDFGPVDATHIYRITVSFNYTVSNPTTIVRSTMRESIDGTTPVVTGPIIDGSDIDLVSPGPSVEQRYDHTFFYFNPTDVDIVRMLVTLQVTSGTGTCSVDLSAGDTKCMFAFEDLGLKAIPVSGGSLSQKSKASGTPDPTPTKTYVKTYAATWSRTWNNAGGSVNVTNGEIDQGQSPATTSFGNRNAWVGFDFATIQSDLTSATVNKVEFYLFYTHWYNNAGGTAVIGTHKSTATSAPSYNSALDSNDRKTVSGWAANSGRWVDMTSIVGTEFKTGGATGITIGPAPTTSQAYYGKAAGNTQSHEPQIRITYTK